MTPERWQQIERLYHGALERTDPPAVNPDIWLIDLARGVSSRLTSRPEVDLYPVWSPDGSRIAFASVREGQLKLYQKLSSGAGDDEELLKSAEPLGVWDWSPDGRFILYRVLAAKTRNDIWVLPLFGDRKPYPLVQTEFTESLARFSPDGRWVARRTGTDLNGFGEIGDGAIEVAPGITLAPTLVEITGGVMALRVRRHCEIENEKENRSEAMIKHVDLLHGAIVRESGPLTLRGANRVETVNRGDSGNRLTVASAGACRPRAFAQSPC